MKNKTFKIETTETTAHSMTAAFCEALALNDLRITEQHDLMAIIDSVNTLSSTEIDEETIVEWVEQASYLLLQIADTEPIQLETETLEESGWDQELGRESLSQPLMEALQDGFNDMQDAILMTLRQELKETLTQVARDAILGALRDELQQIILGSLDGEIKDAILGALRDEIYHHILGALRDEVQQTILGALREEHEERILGALRDQQRILGALRDQLTSDTTDQATQVTADSSEKEDAA